MEDSPLFYVGSGPSGERMGWSPGCADSSCFPHPQACGVHESWSIRIWGIVLSVQSTCQRHPWRKPPPPGTSLFTQGKETANRTAQVQLVYNAASASGAQQRDSDVCVCVCVCVLFQIFPLQVLTVYCMQFPVLQSKSLVCVCFIQWCVSVIPNLLIY